MPTKGLTKRFGKKKQGGKGKYLEQKNKKRKAMPKPKEESVPETKIEKNIEPASTFETIAIKEEAPPKEVNPPSLPKQPPPPPPKTPPPPIRLAVEYRPEVSPGSLNGFLFVLLLLIYLIVGALLGGSMHFLIRLYLGEITPAVIPTIITGTACGVLISLFGNFFQSGFNVEKAFYTFFLGTIFFLLLGTLVGALIAWMGLGFWPLAHSLKWGMILGMIVILGLIPRTWFD